MNYSHIYHAGNFTEVLKHSVLTLIIDYLRQKPAPFCYVDSHAGAGIYDLTSLQAEKTGEANAGVQRIIDYPGPHPDCMSMYLQALKPYRTAQGLIYYPGSPLLAHSMLRANDHMLLNEFHPQINQTLKQNFYGKLNAVIHHRDAYEFLPAILPPRQSRGMVLIDPPFEKEDENEKINKVMQKCLKRWAHGIYLIWYPISTKRSWNLAEIVEQNAIKKYIIAEFSIGNGISQEKGLVGCKLLIVNPPWKLAATLKILLSHLCNIYSINGKGSWSVRQNDTD